MANGTLAASQIEMESLSGTGVITITPPATNTNRAITLPDAAGQVVLNSATQTLTNKTIQGGAITSGTAVASTSGTSIDFTGIPSWVKRITVMFSGVSLSGTANFLIQLGVAATPTTAGYAAGMMYVVTNGSGLGGGTSTSGFPIQSGAASYTLRGSLVFSLLNSSSNLWAGSGVMYNETTFPFVNNSAGSVALSGALGMIRITTTNGTDTFDAGTINIMYEG